MPELQTWLETVLTKTPATTDDTALFNPSNKACIGYLANTPASAVHDAVLAAETAQRTVERDWTGCQRRDALLAWADAIAGAKETLAELEALQGGKPIQEGLVDVDEVVACLRYFAGFADKIKGEVHHVDPKVRSYTIREPVGVCGILTSFNYPIVLAAWKAAPAIASGNAVLIKPHPSTPLSTLYMCQLAERLLPKGLLQVLPGDVETGKAMVAHEKIAKVSFTGSPEIGALVAKEMGSRLSKVTVEGGGKSPLIVDKHLPEHLFGAAVEAVKSAFMANMGQNCVAGILP